MQEIKTSMIAMDEFIFQGQPSVLQIKNKQTNQLTNQNPEVHVIIHFVNTTKRQSRLFWSGITNSFSERVLWFDRREGFGTTPTTCF